MSFVRFIMLLSLVVWVGGIIFFAFVVAPALFGILPSLDMAGSVVQDSLGKLHWIGVGCGAVFLACSLMESRGRIASVRNMAITLMMALTLVSQIAVTGQMERLHMLMGSITAFPANDPLRVHFNALHQWSTRLEVGVLILGLVAIYGMARQQPSAKAHPGVSSVSSG